MGYPVVLIHGMWSTPRNWQRVVELLAARGYDCHVPALPAHEPVPDQPLQVGAIGIRDYQVHLETFIRGLRLERPPILFGHSLGGFLAQALATRLEILALVLLTPAPPSGIRALRGSNLLLASRHFARWRFWRKGFKPSFEGARRDLFNGLPPDQQQRLYEGLVHESGRAIFEMGLAWADWRRAAKIDAGTVKAPVYVVCAGKDRLTPPVVVRQIAGLYEQVSSRFNPERGHWVIDDENTEEMVHAICGWLRPLELRQAEKAGRLPPYMPRPKVRRLR